MYFEIYSSAKFASTEIQRKYGKRNFENVIFTELSVSTKNTFL